MRCSGATLCVRNISSLQTKLAPIRTFKSPHYDEPNILAHVRYNDRVIDGKKTLFVEEVQAIGIRRGRSGGIRAVTTQSVKP